MNLSLFHKYKYNKSPICNKDLIFNRDYTKCVCQDVNCCFNSVEINILCSCEGEV